ncbi:hypothetical protein NQ176_g7608 [Zarea fungicola]|uniref:Uncharacterized protein n=1 Tax=Zarea fungicola TaxID=93591 RepID=A0ACC1MYK3_9HYPO|nr:hypothetical protein NQ176_g7608 [Lecanicillium fungicola]
MVQFSNIALTLGLASRLGAICDYGTTRFPRENCVPVANFGYNGIDGPTNWYSLDKKANKLCAEGKRQSPINIDSAIHTSPANSNFTFRVDSYPEGATLEHLGTTLEVHVNGSLTADNKIYSLSQLHFHTPSEHRFNMEHYAMELHFVFQTASKHLGHSIAVVAFVIEVGGEDALLTSIFDYVERAALPGNHTLTKPLVFKDIEHHLHSNKYYQYSGSLTTPPCSEGVEWYISDTPLGIDIGTYKRVKHVLKFNARSTQHYPGRPTPRESDSNDVPFPKVMAGKQNTISVGK